MRCSASVAAVVCICILVSMKFVHLTAAPLHSAGDVTKRIAPETTMHLMNWGVNRPAPMSDSSGKCPGRYLWVGNTFGRHFNQLSNLLIGLALARHFGRTLVVPDFVEQGGVRIGPESYYNLTRISEAVCFVREADVSLDVATGNTGCVTMRGIAAVPRHPTGYKVVCDTNVFVKFKKNASLVLKAIHELQVSALVVVPLVLYLQDHFLQELVCLWKQLQPSGEVASIVSTARSELSLSSVYLGVHLRSLEGSCRDRVRSLVKDSHVAASVVEQCELSADYISHYRTGDEPMYLAHDGQQPQKVQELSKRYQVRQWSDFKAVTGSHLSVFVDFWLLCQAKEFIGNQLSTLSINVCLCRRSRGLSCTNFDPKNLNLGVC